ncbi:MAG: GntR family transcriptional regulator [Rubrivivax sp.]|nr:GntR family transcriptional regulator [Rubrivivax sp.]
MARSATRAIRAGQAGLAAAGPTAGPTTGARIEKLGDAHSPLTKLAADAIRKRILDGTLAPGERLVEAQLSAELGISRMPVREALRTLAAEGVVTIEPRRGAAVTAYTPEQVQELVEVRATLEALNARLAARRRDPAQHARLAQMLAAGSKVSSRSDLMQVHRENTEFHEAIAQAASNSVLRELVRMLRERTAVIFAPHAPRRAAQTWAEHGAILRAVLDGDAELAALLAQRHVYSAAQALPPGLRAASADTHAHATARPAARRRRA